MHEGLIQLVGQTVGEGRFRVDRALDRGGMGAVFAGVELATGRAVAIKLMHPGLGEEARFLARFRREAEVTARLAHPHVVGVLATGGGEGEPPFIAMELLDGASLSKRLNAGETFDVQRTVRIARQILAGVSAAHAIGVVHRDLKPGNVMLVDAGGVEVAKIVDFGVARLAMTDAMTRLTATGQVIGTPSYMAPEQAMGAPADARVDVYAVGAILHRLLAGEPPYGRGSYADILTRMAGDERERIHARVPGLGRVLDVIERALAWEPEGRYQSADEMNDALAPCDPKPKTTILEWRPPADLAPLRLAPEPEDMPAAAAVAPPGALPTAPAVGSAPPLRRRRGLATVAAVLLAMGLGAVGTWVVFAPDADMAANAGPSDTPVASGPLVAPAVAPVAIGANVADARADTAVSTADAAAATRPGPTHAASARPSRDDPPAPSIHAHFTRARDPTSETPGDYHASYVMRRAQRDVYLEGCWPEGVPLPQGRRVSEFLLVVSADGLLRRVAHHGPPLHPVFDACAVARIGNLTLDPHGAGQTILGVTVSEDGRPAPAIRRGRGGPRQAVVVRFSGSWPIGESGDPSRAILVGSELRRRIDLAPCWPARDPLPTENRGLGLTLDVADDGRISSVRASMADRYPAFTRCVLERLTGLTLESEHVAGRSGISVALDAAH